MKVNLTIRIRPAKNGYIIKFYRGIWGTMFSRVIAKDLPEMLELIEKEVNTTILDVSREQVIE